MPSPNTAIADVLLQNTEAAEQIKAAANELEVVHAVLSTRVPGQAADGDVQAAVARTGEIEQQLSETAQALDESNERLRKIGAEQGAGAAAQA
jgi:hypothetical protein